MSFFTFGAMHRIGSDNQLVKLGQLINWAPLADLLQNIHKNDVHPQGGPKGYNHVSMFKAVLLGQWHSLSDPALEEALKVRLDFILFTELDDYDEIPDETTLAALETF